MFEAKNKVATTLFAKSRKSSGTSRSAAATPLAMITASRQGMIRLMRRS